MCVNTGPKVSDVGGEGMSESSQLHRLSVSGLSPGANFGAITESGKIGEQGGLEGGKK